MSIAFQIAVISWSIFVVLVMVGSIILMGSDH